MLTLLRNIRLKYKFWLLNILVFAVLCLLVLYAMQVIKIFFCRHRAGLCTDRGGAHGAGDGRFPAADFLYRTPC